MTDTQVSTQQGRPPIFALRERLENRKKELALSLPSDVSPDVFIRAVVTSAQRNPDILACTFQSIWNACLEACRDGLMPDGVDGALVAYGSKAGWVPMYQGLLRRFRRSGQFKWVTANVVRSGELFTHYIDESGEHINHVPGDAFEAPIERIYAMATTKDGGLFVTVLPLGEADKIKKMSRAKRDDAPWKLWPEEMYKKTALKRLAKYLPSARDIVGDEDYEPEPELQTSLTNIKAPQADRSNFPIAQADLASGGEQDTPDTVASASSAAAAEADPAATDQIAEQLATAFRRGQEAKAAGQKRSALPGEYRDIERKAECEAWCNGWDGKSQLL